MASYVLLKDAKSEINSEAVSNSYVQIEDVHETVNTSSELDPQVDENKPELQADGAKKQRLKSLDVFRGLTVALMILVDDAGGALPSINHSPWNGVTIADFVMPFFLFIVGVAIAIVFKKVPNRAVATQKVFWRTLKLIILGILLQGGYFHGLDNLTYGVDLQRIRLLGILQRIAVGYFLASICEIWLTKDISAHSVLGFCKKYYLQWLVMIVLTVIYLGFLYGIYVPDWHIEEVTLNFNGIPLNNETAMQTVHCGVRGNLGPACNAVRYVDYSILGVKHLYQRPVYRRTQDCSVNSPDYGSLPPDAPIWCHAPFDPEGLLSTVMASVTCFIGLNFGHILVNHKGNFQIISHWLVGSTILVIFGLLLHFVGMPLNKPLYTLSYMCVTAGAAGFLFTGIYGLVDISGYRWPTVLMEWMGLNALLIYALAACDIFASAIQGFYWRSPTNNIVNAVKTLFQLMMQSKKWGTLAYVLFEIFFWSIIAGVLHSKGIYYKL